jgi:hypothetical protein
MGRRGCVANMRRGRETRAERGRTGESNCVLLRWVGPSSVKAPDGLQHAFVLEAQNTGTRREINVQPTVRSGRCPTFNAQRPRAEVKQKRRGGDGEKRVRSQHAAGSGDPRRTRPNRREQLCFAEVGRAVVGKCAEWFATRVCAACAKHRHPARRG